MPSASCAVRRHRPELAAFKEGSPNRVLTSRMHHQIVSRPATRRENQRWLMRTPFPAATLGAGRVPGGGVARRVFLCE
jgi:hypothetical protein